MPLSEVFPAVSGSFSAQAVNNSDSDGLLIEINNLFYSVVLDELLDLSFSCRRRDK
jgi:hypothetical protein